MYLEIVLAVQRNTYSSLYMHAACPSGAVDTQVIAWMFCMRHIYISFIHSMPVFRMVHIGVQATVVFDLLLLVQIML